MLVAELVAVLADELGVDVSDVLEVNISVEDDDVEVEEKVEVIKVEIDEGLVELADERVLDATPDGVLEDGHAQFMMHAQFKQFTIMNVLPLQDPVESELLH